MRHFQSTKKSYRPTNNRLCPLLLAKERQEAYAKTDSMIALRDKGVPFEEDPTIIFKERIPSENPPFFPSDAGTQLRYRPARTATGGHLSCRAHCPYRGDRSFSSPDPFSELPPRLFVSSLGGVVLLGQIGEPIRFIKNGPNSGIGKKKQTQRQQSPSQVSLAPWGQETYPKAEAAIAGHYG